MIAASEKAFRPERNFNAAVLDSVSYGVAKRLSIEENPPVMEITQSFNQLLSDKQYLQATSRSTADKAYVERRLDAAEQAFAGKKPAQAAMDSAVERGNRLLRQFERANPDR